jgi:phosphohistidine phosphatase
MKRLRILRHAKSSWDDPSLPDHERPLAPRGRRAATRIGRWLVENDARPQRVLCSSAVRARETFELLRLRLDTADVLVETGLYGAGADGLLARVRALPDAVDDVLLIGHNPGVADLCLLLATDGPERERIARKLPTGALALLETDGDSWSGLGEGAMLLRELVLPRELE